LCTKFGVFTGSYKGILDNSQEWGVIDDETGELIDYGQFKRSQKKKPKKKNSKTS
jgi:hypothetical protein